MYILPKITKKPTTHQSNILQRKWRSYNQNEQLVLIGGFILSILSGGMGYYFWQQAWDMSSHIMASMFLLVPVLYVLLVFRILAKIIYFVTNLLPSNTVPNCYSDGFAKRPAPSDRYCGNCAFMNNCYNSSLGH